MSSGGVVRGIVIAVIAIGAITFTIISHNRTQEQKRRAEYLMLIAQHNAGNQILAAVQKQLAPMLDIEKQAREMAAKARDSVAAATGKPFERHPPKGSFVPTTSSPAPAKAKTPADPPRDAAPKAAAVRPDPAPPTDDDAPPGEPSRASLDKLRNPNPDKADPAKNADGANPGDTNPPNKNEAPKKPEAPVAPKPAPRPHRVTPSAPPEPDAVIQARKVVGMCDSIVEKSVEARAVVVTCESLLAEVMASGESKLATRKVKAMSEQQILMPPILTLAQEYLLAMNEPLLKVLAYQDQIEKEKEAKRLAEEQRLKELAHSKLVREELASVENTRQSALEKIKTYLYEESMVILSTKAAELKTAEAKIQIAVIVERYTRLQAIHEFLVSRINVKKFTWGWGSGATAKDVMAATKEAVKLSSGTVPWTEASLPQMTKLLKYYIADSEIDRKVRAEHQISLAIFYREHGMDDEAKKLTAELLEGFPTLKEEIKRLLP